MQHLLPKIPQLWPLVNDGDKKEFAFFTGRIVIRLQRRHRPLYPVIAVLTILLVPVRVMAKL